MGGREGGDRERTWGREGGGQERLRETVIKCECNVYGVLCRQALSMVSRHYVGPSTLAMDVRHEYEKVYLNFPKESEIPDCSNLEGRFYGLVRLFVN